MTFVTLSESELAELIRRTALAVTDELRQDVATPTPELMTKAECAEYLRCDISKINRLMVRDERPLPVLQFGGTPRFRKSEIDHWLQNERIQTLQGQAN